MTNPLSRIGPTADSGRQPEVLQEGDLVSWSGRLAIVEGLVTFPAVGTHVTIRFLDRRSLPMSVRLDDLAGSPHWRLAGELGRR